MTSSIDKREKAQLHQLLVDYEVAFSKLCHYFDEEPNTVEGLNTFLKDKWQICGNYLVLHNEMLFVNELISKGGYTWVSILGNQNFILNEEKRVNK